MLLNLCINNDLTWLCFTAFTIASSLVRCSKCPALSSVCNSGSDKSAWKYMFDPYISAYHIDLCNRVYIDSKRFTHRPLFCGCRLGWYEPQAHAILNCLCRPHSFEQSIHLDSANTIYQTLRVAFCNTFDFLCVLIHIWIKGEVGAVKPV